MTVQEAIRQATKLLEEGGTGVPRLTAEVLLCHALRRERSYLYAHPEQPLSDNERIHFGRYLHERLDGRPTQYITGHQEFYGRDFAVSPAVLIPRPETEHLVETCLALNLPSSDRRTIDVGCGSGAIAITLALEDQRCIFAVDLSAEALCVAAENARALNARVQFWQGDLLAGVAPSSFDLVASNPPYVPYSDHAIIAREVRDFEPALALYGGTDGNDAYRRLIPQAARALRAGGYLAMELGITSIETVQALLTHGWTGIRTVDDLAGIPRVLVAQRQP